jgi:1,4-alpha-glucan branching enzyme
MAEPLGYELLLLHAHLPFVRHPEHEEFLEEDWLYEAITETYLPVLKMLAGFERDGVKACFSISVTPPLCEMLADPLLQSRYLQQLGQLEELANREVSRTRNTPFHSSALMYEALFHDCREIFEKRWNRNILDAFRYYQEQGFLEVLTCSATHALLPMMVTTSSVRAQLAVAVTNYRKHFGRAPRGMWLPECAYAPGLDKHIRAAGIEFFFLDTHGVAFGTPRPR